MIQQYGGCPRCGSNNVQVVTETKSHSRGYDFCSGCLGGICFWPWGLLCGLCGTGEKTDTAVYRMCGNCGAKFR